MKSLLNLIYSSKATLLFLLVFALSMAVATFVEDKYDTPTAYKYIYGAKWFELIMVLLAVNFIGNIHRYNLLSKKKFTGFLFHAAFIVMILGAGVTRYFGFEGMMHIREGQSSDIMVMPKNGIKVLAIDKGEVARYHVPVELKDTNEVLHFQKTIGTKSDGDLIISCKEYLQNVTEILVENADGGVNIIKLNILDQGTERDLFIPENEISMATTIPVSYQNSRNTNGINIYVKESQYWVQSASELTFVTLPDMSEGVIAAGTPTLLIPNTQYSSPDKSFRFIFHGGFNKAKKKLVSGSTPNGISAMLMNINYNNRNYEVPVFIGSSGFAEMQYAHLPGISLLLGYGEKEIRLPFALRLNDFIIDRYPGSSSPSSYASEVTIQDSRIGAPQNFRIYMNHILDHDGYRFFQSSYDKDEQGTILSVNHDFWGTWITYLGYFLLALGFILNMFNRNARFQILARSIREIRKIRINKMAMLLVVFGISSGLFAQDAILNPVDKQHAERLGYLISQTYDGRSEPVHTLAYDVMHKISRKDKFEFAGKGEMDAMQVFIDLILNSGYWKGQKIIYVREKSVADILHIEGKYAAYNDLVDNAGIPKLKQYAEEAFRKKPQEQNPFDKEVLKVTERLEIFMMATQGSLLKIFPEPVANSTVWISWDNPQAQVVLQDSKNLAGELQIPQFNYNNFMGAYLNAVYHATSSGDYTRADKILALIDDLQRHSAVADFIPTKKQVEYEVYYNKAGIFITLRNIYGLLAVILLILAYAENFIEKRNKFISGALNIFLVILGAAFAYHTYGMALRWYLSGHAPWSNGYEALLLVGWAGILAGFSFIKFSKIPLAATALLAFFTLMTASHSSYDPQITNLQPVLKSYWLIVHVATLTISYGFLGLAFILGLFTLTFYLFKNHNNEIRFNLLIKELTNINEMNVTVGLMLATIGTFLGGIWANESWGRYWGWDAKETWALIITMVFSIVVHLRLVDKFRGDYLFSVGTVLGFSSVLMTFIGVNYYLSKGMHSYGAGETPIFPVWAWIMILSVFALIIAAGMKDKSLRNKS